MKKVWKYVKMILVTTGLAALFSFANHRNGNRLIFKDPTIEFTHDDGMFITRHSVNKLLIQKADSSSGIPKEKLVLKNAEDRLNAHDMIKRAEVYVTVDGHLGAKITQRTPLVRVGGTHSFYIDDEGRKMPLSPVFSARVPLLTGVEKEADWKEGFPLFQMIHEDEFLRKQVIGIHRTSAGFELHLRGKSPVITLGEPKQLEEKLKKLKAFYQKTSEDNSLASYHAVNLTFANQVVCTKK